MKNKEKIRKDMFNLRNQLNREEIIYKSKKIFETILEMKTYNESNMIMCYMDFRNEVETKEFIEFSLLKGKRIVLPLIDKANKSTKNIVPLEVEKLDKDLKKGVLGILEPNKETCKKINPVDIDLIIVPGVAFDLLKNRIGYGAGYYDKFLGGLRLNILKIGVAYDFQILNKIKTKEHDIPLDVIVTEKRVIS